MAKVFLTCFSPFNPKERPFRCHSLRRNNINNDEDDDDECGAVLASLIHDLQKSESISLKWCSEAMLLIKTMHSRFLTSLWERISRVSGSWERAVMADDYLKESLHLLDLCNLLRSAISPSKPKPWRPASNIQNWKAAKTGGSSSSSSLQSAIAVVSLMVHCAVVRPLPLNCKELVCHEGCICIERLVRFEEVDVSKLFLDQGLQMFKSVVDEVFDQVIQGRSKVLCFIHSDTAPPASK